jgi:hypothetical protein
VLKSKENGPVAIDLNSISKKLRLAAIDLVNPQEGDMHGKLKELMQKAGK